MRPKERLVMKAKLIALCLATIPATARAEPVYDFVASCRQEQLAECFHQIEQRLTRLNAGANSRICLPKAFGATMFESVGIPVSVLDHVRLGLSAARFGDAGRDVDDVMSEIVTAIYPCD
jgi:hypothetical protein